MLNTQFPLARIRREESSLYASLPSPEESAKALSDYMAKSHEDKLRAIKAVEDKKNAEIKVHQTTFTTCAEIKYQEILMGNSSTLFHRSSL